MYTVEERLGQTATRRGVQDVRMKHIKTVTVAKASDPFGDVFFQVWLTAFVTMLSAAFGSK